MSAQLSRRFLLSLVLAAVSAPAWAHAILMESTPAIGAEVRPGVTPFSLRFNSRIDARRSRVTLIGPDGAAAVMQVVPDAVGVVLHGVATLLPGANVLRWQVLAIDGHITRGDVAFTVKAP